MNRSRAANQMGIRWYIPYMFLLPNLFVFTTFIIIPAFVGAYYSFTKWDGITAAEFVGFDNFIKIMKDAQFWAMLKRTLFYVIAVVPLTYAVALLCAYLLIQDIRAKNVYRAIIYIPTMISSIVVGVSWKWILGQNFGIANYLLEYVGLRPINWLTDDLNANLSVIMVSVWGKAGFFMVIFIAGLQSISSQYYEAAELDGAGPLQRFRWITMPLLKPTSVLVLIICMIESFKSYALVYALSGGGPGRSTTFIVQQVFITGFEQGRIGYASAMSLILFFILALLTLVQMKWSRGGAID